jgi:hypothetical protein
MPLPGNDHDHTMQMARDDSDRKSNPRAPLTRVLSRHRHVRLRQNNPRREFRDQLVGECDFGGVLLGTPNGGCRTLQAVLESEGDR